MLNIKNYIKINIPLNLFLIVFSFQISFVFAQTKTNLQVFYSLVDSSVAGINQKVSTKYVKVNYSKGNNFSVFQNEVISDFVKLGRTVLADSNKNTADVTSINYIIDNAKVKYGDMERDGFFGDFIMPREIKLSGSYSLSERVVDSQRFNLTYTDTVAVDDVKVIENSSFPFTEAQVPSEPFFSSLFEPVVAIGSAAVAVILFFTVRSK